MSPDLTAKNGSVGGTPLGDDSGQRPFLVHHQGDPSRTYGLGAATSLGTLLVWIDVYTGRLVFHTHRSPEDAVIALQHELGPTNPVELAWDDRPVPPGLEYFHEDMIRLDKASIPRPDHDGRMP